MKVSRRVFVKSGGVAMIGMSTIPAFLQRAVAATPMPNKKKLIVLFQRGAADGLNIVVPFGEENYYRIRPTIAIPQPRQGGEGAAIDLDGFFGLHPSLAPLGPLFHNGQLAIVHAAGSPDTTRSHFDAQDFMESGTPGVKSTDDGWLNRTVQSAHEENSSPFRAVAMGPNLPLTLRGPAPAIALADVKQFRVLSESKAVQGGFEALYAQTVDRVLRGTGTETFEAIDMLRKADPARFQSENGADYPKNHVGQTLQQVAQLVKADIGMEVSFVDTGGWDKADFHADVGFHELRDLLQSLAHMVLGIVGAIFGLETRGIGFAQHFDGFKCFRTGTAQDVVHRLSVEGFKTALHRR